LQIDRDVKMIKQISSFKKKWQESQVAILLRLARIASIDLEEGASKVFFIYVNGLAEMQKEFVASRESFDTIKRLAKVYFMGVGLQCLEKYEHVTLSEEACLKLNHHQNVGMLSIVFVKEIEGPGGVTLFEKTVIQPSNIRTVSTRGLNQVKAPEIVVELNKNQKSKPSRKS
jgi:hypothetical protein